MAVRHQHEQALRETLREIRIAIDEFHRDTAGMQCVGTATGFSSAPGFTAAPDRRSKVIIADCTIFGVDNPDRYPPDLETLVNGVAVVPRVSLITANGPSGPNGWPPRLYCCLCGIRPLPARSKQLPLLPIL